MKISLPTFTLDSAGIEERLLSRVSLLEAFALALPIGLMLMFVFLNTKGMELGPDFAVLLKVGHGNYYQFYYAYWSVPLWQGLALLPGTYTAYILWCLVNIFATWFAVRVFGGSAPMTLLSYQMFFIVFYGQSAGVIVAGLALIWWGLNRKRWWLAGIGAALALIKWQMGAPLCIALVLLSDSSWYDRLRTLLVVLVITLLSLLLFPNWIVDVLLRLAAQPPSYFGDVSLWSYIGAASLVLWIPPLLLPLSRGRRYTAICAAGALAVPYFQQTGLLTMFVLPIGWLPLLGNLSYLYLWFRDNQMGFAIGAPLAIYFWAILPPLGNWINARFRAATV